MSALDDAMRALAKRGINAAGSATSMLNLEKVTTGLLSLDYILGGGFPKGRILEIYGFESSGKSSACLIAIAATQQRNATAALIDLENSYDPKWASKMGVDTSKLIIIQPFSGEDGLTAVQKLAETKEVDLIVIDSMAALLPKAEIEGEFEDHTIGLQARLMSKALRKLSLVAAKTGTTIIFINQLRYKIGLCFDGNTRISLADGTTMKISTLVDNKHPGPILTVNKQGEIVSVPIVQWHSRVTDGTFIRVRSKDNNNIVRAFNATPDHLICTTKGDIKAKNLKNNDKILILNNKLKSKYVGLAKVISVESFKKGKSKPIVYDIGLAKHHKYFAQKCLVHNSYGDPTTTPGGMALKFYASIRLRVAKKDKIKTSKGILGHKIKIDVVKSKVSAPYVSTDARMLFESGIDRVWDTFMVARLADIIKKTNNTYMYGKTKLAVGIDAAIAELRSDPVIFGEIRGDCVSALETMLIRDPNAAVTKAISEETPENVETTTSTQENTSKSIKDIPKSKSKSKPKPKTNNMHIGFIK